ncbi:UDP-2,4-diacetamido-2,4,6-trideoxy-beta-L-altropyranose hydrolase [Paenibacillus vandeheii]
MSVRVIIRSNASSRLGTGHVKRCLTLAILMRGKLDADILFVCNADLPDILKKEIQANGFLVHLLSEEDRVSNDIERDAQETILALNGRCDLLIVDHYGLDIQWEQKLRPYTDRILIVDDLANRKHDCDILLDQNLYSNLQYRYDDLVHKNTKKFLGPGYALLQNDFFELGENANVRKRCEKVLVNFGGSDPTNELAKMLPVVLSEVGKRLEFILVAGPANLLKEKLRAMFSLIPHVQFYEEHNMAELLSWADIAIGAGGVSMWERCFMGVPAMVISVADNQIATIAEAANCGLIWDLGPSENVNDRHMISFLEAILANPKELEEKSKLGLTLMEETRRIGTHPILAMFEGSNN